MQFYVASAVVDKGITPKTYSGERVDAINGAILSDIVSIFIVVATRGSDRRYRSVELGRAGGLRPAPGCRVGSRAAAHVPEAASSLLLPTTAGCQGGRADAARRAVLRRQGVFARRRRFMKSVRSFPLVNTYRWPWMSTTRTAGSLAARSSAAAISAYIATVSVLLLWPVELDAHHAVGQFGEDVIGHRQMWSTNMSTCGVAPGTYA